MTFAVWLTGLSGSGKSAIAKELAKKLNETGVRAAVLESDMLRTQITPFPRYDESERDLFYETLLYFGRYLVGRDVPVIFDATANKRSYREEARRHIRRFAEIYVDTPLEVCELRDPKGLYRAAREGKSSTLPGLQAAYELPLQPDLVVHGDRGTPREAATDIVAFLKKRGWLLAYR